jgi:hypothetical protein
MKISKNLSGIAGTYYVAAELSKRGYVALVTMKNTSGVDLLVSSEKSFNSVGIQVKTNQTDKRQGWLLSKKNEDLKSDNLIYVFVNLKSDNSRPDFYIAPSEIIAKTIKTGHKRWLDTPGKNNKMHNDSSLRMFFDNDNNHKEKWELIENKLNIII